MHDVRWDHKTGFELRHPVRFDLDEMVSELDYDAE